MVVAKNPGTWQQFVAKEENKDIPLMKLKQRYLYAKQQYIDYQNYQRYLHRQAQQGGGPGGDRTLGQPTVLLRNEASIGIVTEDGDWIIPDE